MVDTIIRKHLLPSENFIYGFADLRGLLGRKFSGFEYGISIARKLDDTIVDRIINGPSIEYYDHYREVNTELERITRNISADLESLRINSLPVEPTILPGKEGYNKKYLRTLSVDLSHKMVATRAGLGWIGKTDLFISREFGPRLRLVSILLEKSPGKIPDPVIRSLCGQCNLCVEKCPAGAANGKSWVAGTERGEFFDPQKCRKKCGELAFEKLHVDARICGMCVSVCPIGIRRNE